MKYLFLAAAILISALLSANAQSSCPGCGDGQVRSSWGSTTTTTCVPDGSGGFVCTTR